MAFKMKGSPYTTGTHATKKTMAYQASPLPQYNRLEGYTYGDEVIDPDYKGPGTGYMIEGTKPSASSGEKMSNQAWEEYLANETSEQKRKRLERESRKKLTDVQRRVEMDTEPITLDPIKIGMDLETPTPGNLEQIDFPSSSTSTETKIPKKKKTTKKRRRRKTFKEIVNPHDLHPWVGKNSKFGIFGKYGGKDRKKVFGGIGRTLKKMNPAKLFKSRGGNCLVDPNATVGRR